MEKLIGTSNNLLEINLSTNSITKSKINPKDREMYLGGKGLGLKLLYNRMNPGVNPLGADNMVAFMMGAFLGTGAACTARWDAVTKSPLTNIMLSSSCGGPFGLAFKTAGYDGLLLSGKSEKPVYIKIDENGASIEDASELWGKDTDETQEWFNLDKKDGVMVIGVAGENLVKFANVKSGHRFLGRGGIGAVLGSKNVKAIVAYGGKYKITPVDEDNFIKLKKKANKFINRNETTSKLYRKFGTASHVSSCNESGILPVNNFSDGYSEKANLISGETYREKHDGKSSSCKLCTIQCGHKGTFGKNKILQFPEYETVGLMGSNLGNYDTFKLAEWNDLCGKLGLDTISVGGTLSFVMEATEKGLMQTDLKFGTSEGIEKMLYDISLRKGIGDDVANGSRWLADKYGGKEFAMNVKGLEFAAYDPRGAWGQGLSYAVANRGACHLSAPVFALEGILHLLKPNTIRYKAKFVDYFEDMFAAINSLHTCQFTSYAYMLEPFIAKTTPNKLLAFMMQYLAGVALVLMDVSVYNKLYTSITGIKLSQNQMFKTGRRIHLLERYMNTREGISKKDDTLPKRFLEESRKSDTKNRVVPLEKMLEKYYKMKGYDTNGIPLAKTLSKLGIEV
ncbi:MAG: aldehyde ferredoxin oxidoreductase family protein [Bacteroidales bacterium]|nr:aldehyde ferredoxin oxidoreductase family protein [Bacteroidales bacterium]MBN2757751.1 aldehyde ferredoxin oxidoreductase family protein [Bacteroidales bacterium]